ncbi:solute carrier family 23 protein [Providencia hangzhouensis]|uniref:solute carrier family 23 protein n=1 Tax=Providencia hangzhouensis TaxID=3031799 RepID=UPI0034DD8F33
MEQLPDGLLIVGYLAARYHLFHQGNGCYFPLGKSDEINISIVLTAILRWNIKHIQYVWSERGTDVFYPNSLPVKSLYRRSFMMSGVVTILAAPIGVVPFSPFVSSIGLITQQKDSSRISFTIGSLIFLCVGGIAVLTQFFRSLPLAIGSAVMLATYLPLLFSSFSFLADMKLNARNISSPRITYFYWHLFDVSTCCGIKFFANNV